MASGSLVYTPKKWLSFQAGHGKNFIGDGYRSLLLSDNAFNYPYLRTTFTFGKLQYNVMYASFQNILDGRYTLSAGSEPLFKKKQATFHY